MSNAPKNAGEKVFQQNFVDGLQKYKWEAPDCLDGNKQKVTVDDLVNHWRNELNRLNADQLEGVPLTDGEFKQVMSKVSQISNSYEAAKVLAIEESKGKIDGIYRDDHPDVSRKTITLTIFKKAQVRGGDSSYKIAREVATDSGNRFDLVLLINGLPLINIEQKRTDRSLDEAVGQFKRYYQAGEYNNNFMAFSQMMVVNSEIETRYFATPKSLGDFNPAFVFNWSDKTNKHINDWQKIIEYFLMIPMAHQMVGDYLVIDEDPDNEENRRHMLMRPYQVYALQSVQGAAFGWNNDGVAHGGFVWHTTGSGKTITSFKTAQFLSTQSGFDKVVFLVDRKDLDKQTTKNFKAYAHYESVDVDETKSTNKLRSQLKASKAGIVITTTFKLSNLVKELEEGHDTSFADKKIVFIIDEAHRTTMGDMMGDIRRYFKKNGLFFGFTGTPLFDENNVKGKVNKQSERINTTEKLFGPKLHQYTIDQAIADGNVLGFNVDYINTGEFKSYDDLRDQLIEQLKANNPDKAEKDVEREIQTLSNLEVEEKAVKEGILVYQDETHIPRVVTEILDGWQKQSQGGEFNAILTAAYKERAIAFYHEFKKQIADKFECGDRKPTFAMTFSFGNENDLENISREVSTEMFEDYESFTGIKFTAGDKKRGEDAYFEDLTERATRGGSGRNSKNIDFVIVANQLLTGYDSKRLNTLYVDRTLKLQDLIQAYSRTNRVFGSTKEFGTIINFKYPEITKKMVNAALELYGSGGSSSPAIVEPYETAVKKLSIEIDTMVEILPDPTQWADIKDAEDVKADFKAAFLSALEQLNLVQQYYEYKWHNENFGMDEHTWLQYRGAYINLFPRQPGEDGPEALKPLPGKTKLQSTQVINASYILKLIGEKIVEAGSNRTVDGETLRIIYQQIQELSDMGENEQAKLLKEFVDTQVLTGNLSSGVDFDLAFRTWRDELVNDEIQIFAEEWGIDKDLLKRSFDAYSTSKSDEIPYFDEITKSVDFAAAKNQSAGNKLKHNIHLKSELKSWMPEVKQRFN